VTQHRSSIRAGSGAERKEGAAETALLIKVCLVLIGMASSKRNVYNADKNECDILEIIKERSPIFASPHIA